MSISQHEELRVKAAEEELKRRKCREDLYAWAQVYGADRNWKFAAHHKLLMEKLQAITDGKLISSTTGKPVRKLMVLMPPGSAKSQVSSVLFPAWFVQRRPMARILSCSHSAELIEGFSYECRNAIQLYANILGTTLRRDSKAVKEWNTTNGSEYFCAGVGAGLAGRRADAAIIDDYIGSEEEANSQTVRDKIWAWYQNDLWPRLKPNAVLIIVANRRHEEDLVGRLIEREAAQWEIIKLPFFANENDPLGREPGARLWPEWFTEEMSEEIRKLPARTQAGLYGQEPAPDEGDYFKREWLLTYTQSEYEDLMRRKLRVFAAGDWAISEERGANKTCFGGGVLDDEGFLYILPDLFWKSAGPKELVSSFVDFLKRRNPIQVFSEKGHISKSLGPFIKEQMLEQQVYTYITEVVPSKSKEARAQSIRGRMSMLRVKFPGFASWWPAAIHELLMFPGGKNDDFVDFLAHLGMGINSMTRTPRLEHATPEQVNIAAAPITLTWIKKSHKSRLRAIEPKYSGR